MIILPETPRYLVKTGKHDKALRALAQLRRLPTDHPSIVHELDEIEANHEFELTLGKATYLDCFKGNVGKRLLTGCLLQILQQLTGVNFIFYYGTNCEYIGECSRIALLTACSLQELWYPECIRHSNDHVSRQRRIYPPRSLRH